MVDEETPLSAPSAPLDAPTTDETTAATEGAAADTTVASEAEQIATALARQQFNAHDAKVLAKQIDQMLLALRGMGLAVDMSRIKATADAQAACEILVAHGLASEAEVQSRAYLAARNLMASILQQAEEQQLAQHQQASKIEVAKRPGLVVARH